MVKEYASYVEPRLWLTLESVAVVNWMVWSRVPVDALLINNDCDNLAIIATGRMLTWRLYIRVKVLGPTSVPPRMK